MSENNSPSSPGGPRDSTSTGPGTAPQASAPGQAFFDWIRRLGVSRGDAWIGGVCGGIAARLGIDPMIVRGIAVVVALLGGPAFLLYAVAWLLLPDTVGTIHLERLVRGTFEAATAGVIVFVLLAFLPIAQGVWWAASWPFGAAGGWPVTVGKLFWSAVVVAAIVLLIVWISRRSGGWGAGSWVGTAANPGAPDPYSPGSAAPSGSSSATWASQSTVPPPAAPAGSASRLMPESPTGSGNGAPIAPEPPLPNASADALAEWRTRQAEWRGRWDEWKRQQSDEARIRRDQRSAAAAAEAARRQADAFERVRVRRLTHPRTSGAHVAITLGLALIVGALAAATSWNVPALHDYQAAFGFAAATAVIGLSMMVAGILRRSSGFLAAVAIVLTIVTLALIFGGVHHEIDVKLPGSYNTFHF